MQLTHHMDDRTQPRGYRCLLAWGAFFVIALSGCQSAAQSHPAILRQPAPEQTPARPFESGSRKYRECVAAAGDDARARERCLDEELAYRQRSLDRLYQEWAAELDAAQRNALHAEHHTWQQESDRLCGPAAGVQSVDQVCRLDRIIARYDVLNHRLSGATSGHWAEDMPDADGTLEKMRLGDAVITMQSDGCTGHGITRLICSNARLSVSTPTLHRQVLLLPEVWFPRTIRPEHSATTGFRGSLHAGFAEGWYGIVLSDIDADGHEDLMVWSGSDGSHGDPSYTYYFYDPKARRLVENTALVDMVKGHSLSRIADGRLSVWYRSGPCERGEKSIDVRDGTPRIVERRDYTTCAEEAL